MYTHRDWPHNAHDVQENQPHFDESHGPIDSNISPSDPKEHHDNIVISLGPSTDARSTRLIPNPPVILSSVNGESTDMQSLSACSEVVMAIPHELRAAAGHPELAYPTETCADTPALNGGDSGANLSSASNTGASPTCSPYGPRIELFQSPADGTHLQALPFHQINGPYCFLPGQVRLNKTLQPTNV
jgi:hypothetical protein